ncbi:hypothetical protein P3T73_05980 [Kiritimatiellota bacterium B12222]|nr:hypothetical protein P3T73_05980 [Kiritimatiellota bacterium B12222]
MRVSLPGKFGRLTLLAGGCLLLLMWVSWPLPHYFAEGVISSHRPEVGAPRSVILGDHLQLMYHFELMKGFLTGETPWMYNLYEFNTGDDASTYFPDFYYAPFSVIYALGSMLGLPGLGWNMASFLSVVFGIWGTWKLVRSYHAPLSISIAATLFGSFLPYRWVTLLHGSPTGFAMVYVPWILYGLKIAIDQRKMRGGWIAGLALLLSAWGDIHTFFFSGLLVPFWCLFVFFSQAQPRITLSEMKDLAKSLSGFIVFGLLTVGQALFIKAHLSDGSMSEGRTVEEVALFSPNLAGLFDLNPDHPHNLVYLTYSGLLLLAFAVGMGIQRFRRQKDGPKLRFLLLGTSLFAAAGLIIILSMGPSLILEIGPKYWRLLCQVIPPYSMIRQPAKIFSILPPVLALCIVFPFANRKKLPWKHLNLVILLLSLCLVAETAGRIKPTISLLDNGNAAYAAIRSQAEAQGKEPRALAIVLWPGDSHWSSLYQYYAIRHQIRMLNGYSPHVSEGYFDDVFMRYNPLNQGYADDALLDHLLARDTQFLVLHEDAFPEKVSPFGVGQTLSGLLAHPRIRLLTRENAIWSFEILQTASDDAIITTDWPYASPSMVWPLSYYGPKPDSEWPQLTQRQDPDAYQQQYVRLNADTSFLRLAPYPTFYRESLRISLRYRGKGKLQASFQAGEQALAPLHITLDAEEWTWTEIPFPAFEGFKNELSLQLKLSQGEADFDVAMMMEGPSVTDMKVGEEIFIPAASFFHAGYSEIEEAYSGNVRMDPDRVPFDEVLYGPRLPFPAGRYHIIFRSMGTINEAFGTLRVRKPIPGEPMTIKQGVLDFIYDHPSNLPFELAYTYPRSDAIRIQGVEIIRLEDQE